MPGQPEFVRGLRQLWLSMGTGLLLGGQLFSAPLLKRPNHDYERVADFILEVVGTLLANTLLLVRAGLYFVNRISDGLAHNQWPTW